MTEKDFEIAFESVWATFENTRDEFVVDYRMMHEPEKRRYIRKLINSAHLLVVVDSKLCDSSPKGL